MAPPVNDAVNLRIGIVAAEERGGRVLTAMMREVERFLYRGIPAVLRLDRISPAA